VRTHPQEAHTAARGGRQSAGRVPALGRHHEQVGSIGLGGPHQGPLEQAGRGRVVTALVGALGRPVRQVRVARVHPVEPAADEQLASQPKVVDRDHRVERPPRQVGEHLGLDVAAVQGLDRLGRLAEQPPARLGRRRRRSVVEQELHQRQRRSFVARIERDQGA